MKRRYQSKFRYPLNLQLFADNGGDPPAASGSDNGGGSDPAAAGDPPGDKGVGDKVTFSPEQQAEVDRILGERLGKAQTKWEKDFQAKLDEAKTEAEKLAKMNADQKAEYEKQKRETELNKRESEITRRELRATALETLAEKGLPKSLADILDYSDADTTNKSLEAVDKAFMEAVEAGVNERLKGRPPGGGGSGGATGANSVASAIEQIFSKR